MSALPRLFVKADLSPHAEVALAEDQANYLLRVMRLGVGDVVRVFNGRDGEWRAHVAEAGRKSGVLVADLQMRAQTAPEDLALWFAPLKKARTDFVVEKATELGVSSIQPVITARTQADKVREERLQRIAEEAAEQTERMDVPVIEAARPLFQALDEFAAARTLYFADEAGDNPDAPWGGDLGRASPLIDALKAAPKTPAIILIGPEGGFAPEERAQLRKRPSVVPVSLGPRILRAETAAISALTLWQSVLGDWT